MTVSCHTKSSFAYCANSLRLLSRVRPARKISRCRFLVKSVNSLGGICLRVRHTVRDNNPVTSLRRYVASHDIHGCRNRSSPFGRGPSLVNLLTDAPRRKPRVILASRAMQAKHNHDEAPRKYTLTLLAVRLEEYAFFPASLAR